MGNDLMDGREASMYIKVLSYWTLLELAKQGKVPCIRIGRRVFFRKESLNKWLDEIEGCGSPFSQETTAKYGILRKVRA